ncbi:hypothetical protein G5C51_31715 [Streptomyces sp. A7024]|uniref:Uncharacterized protein n=1 Tax=Streptomyces coryli TaxID=1128680 RepID=A0A6G4U8X0_9ACTN|nr:hypothetical protein [Streptomyces coryli]NGN68452.1 hypothetical protein [Streptomyces coryli]
MAYEFTAYTQLSGKQETLSQDTRPACVGAFESSTPGCVARPDHVVTYTVNKSGLPGLGKARHQFACYRHLHRLLMHAEHATHDGIVTVTAYQGI